MCIKSVALALCIGFTCSSRNKHHMVARDSCAQFDSLIVNGKNFSNAAKFVCEKWPGGNFPLDKVQKYRDLLQTGMSEGGVWELLEKAKAENAKNFCYKDIQVRQKVSNKCDMKFAGKCYGKCLAGYQPSKLVGGFAPICVSVCTESSNRVGCVLGCAKSKISCALTVMDQVKDAANVVSNIKNLVLNNPLINGFLNQLRSIADFAMGVMKRVKETAMQQWRSQDKKTRTALLMTAVYTFFEEFKQLKQDVGQLKDMISTTAGMFRDFMEGDVSPAGIGKALIKYGKYVISEAFKVSDLFTTDRCKAIDRDVAFTVEDAGTESIIGAYYQNGTHDGRPQYIQKGNDKVRMNFNKGQWRFYQQNGPFWSTFYRNKDTRSDYPIGGWYKVDDGQKPTPEVVMVKEASQ